MATFLIPTPLRKFTNNQASVEVKGNIVIECVNHLVAQFDGLKRNILDENGSVREFIRLYVGDTDVNEMQGEQTPIAESTVISIIPAIAGGTK